MPTNAQSATEITMTTGHTMSQTPQSILITGGASGLGRAMAEAWLRAGARVLEIPKGVSIPLR